MSEITELVAVYKALDGVRVLPLDSSLPGVTHQLVCGKRRAAVDARLAALLLYLQEPRSTQDLLTFCARKGVAKPEEALTQLLDNTCVKMFIGQVIEGEEPVADETRAAADSFPLKFTVLKARAVELLALPMTYLFRARVAAVVVSLIVASHAFLLPSKAVLLSHRPTFWQMALVVLGVYASLFMHELGHSAACLRFGVAPGPIGLGFYWIWPVTFADLSDSWILPRMQRAVIDLAGVYVQLAVSAVCLLISHIEFNVVLSLISASILLSMIINANPFLRFDGYWLLTDLLGVPSLKAAGVELGSWLLSLLRSRSTEDAVYLKKLKRLPVLLRSLLFSYCAASIAFYGYWSVRIAVASPRVFAEVPGLLKACVTLLTKHPASLQSFRAGGLLFVSLLSSMEIGLFIYWRCRKTYVMVARNLL
jgi:putative peptide zinc metalloprotease protein